MSRERFINLIQDFCKTCGIADTNHVASGGSLMVQGMTMSIVHSEKIDPMLMQIFCDMGEMPKLNASDQYAKLLQKNFYFQSIRGLVFVIDPTCSRVVLIQSCSLDGLTKQQLLSAMSRLADEASTWNYLPSDLPQVDPVAPNAFGVRRPAALSHLLQRTSR